MCNNKFQIGLQAPDLLSAKTLILNEQNVIGRGQVRTQWPRSLNLKVYKGSHSHLHSVVCD